MLCTIRMQNEVLPEQVGPITIHANGCLNLTSSLMDGQVMTRPYSPSPFYTETERTYRHLIAAC